MHASVRILNPLFKGVIFPALLASSLLHAQTFREWQEQHFSAAELANASLEQSLWGSHADPDNDKLSNMVEFAFNGDPRVPETGELPKLVVDVSSRSLQLTKQREFVRYRVEHSTSPTGPWSQSGLDAFHASLDALAAGQSTQASLPVGPEPLFARVVVSLDEPAPTRMPLGTNLWNFRWGTSGRADYYLPSNQVNWSTVDNPWLPRFLEEMSIYSVVRFMDQVPTNSSSVRSWSQRTLPTANHHTTSGGAVAYEWQIDLCNRLGADIWLTLPHLTIENYESNPQNNYFTELAKLVRQRLNPELNVYVEYSNETWSGGGSFRQGDYVSERGLAMGFSNDAEWAKFYFHVYAATRLHKVFLDEFADSPERVKPVIAGHASRFLGTRHIMRALQNINGLGQPDERLNPYNIIPDYLAIANYISTDDGGVANIREAWAEQLAFRTNFYRSHLLEITRSGLPIEMISYEGGQHYTTNAHIFSQNPESYDMYMEWLETVSQYFKLTMHYTHVGSWASGGAWGAKSSTSQSVNDAHRYRALRDWVMADSPE